MKVPRNHFIELALITFASATAGGCERFISPTPEITPTLPDYLLDQENLNTLRASLGAEFVKNTKYQNPDGIQRLNLDWNWLITKEELDNFTSEYSRQFHGADTAFYGLTLTDNEQSRRTYININYISNLNWQLESGQPLYRQEELSAITSAVILHEMERKAINIRAYNETQQFRSPLNSTSLSTIGEARGFQLITKPTTEEQSDINGDPILVTHSPSMLGVTIGLDIAVAEASAAQTLGAGYFQGYVPGILYSNLNSLISPLDIEWQTVLDMHRESDPFAFGNLISEKMNYRSTSPIASIKAWETASVGLGIASFASNFGYSDETVGYLRELGLQWPK